MALPLDDIVVLDLSHALAGPFCSTVLADFSARVIKSPRATGTSPAPGARGCRAARPRTS